MATLVKKFFAALPRFPGQVAGNVSIMFAIAAVPVLLAAGSAIDIVRSNRAETQLQAAIDGAALAMATSVIQNNGDQRKIGLAYLASNLDDAILKQVIPRIAFHGSVVTVSARLDYPTSFMSLVGIDNMKISGHSEVDTGSDSNAEMAMVLDYSYSMTHSNKYIRMRDAAIKMINQLEKAKGGASLKVGVVPFSAMVLASMPAEYVSQASASGDWTGCTQDRKYPWNNGVTSPDGSADSLWGYVDPGSENSGSHSCATYVSDNLQIMPLTDDLDSIRTRLGQMYPVGNTNIPLGVEFGWNLLDAAAPYTEAAPFTDSHTKKFLLLLTDGVQTSKQWDSSGARSVQAGNDNLLTLCSGIDRAGITVFAVAYDVTDPKVTGLLKTCAGANYFEASTAGNEIDTVFRAITLRIKKTTLRIAR